MRAKSGRIAGLCLCRRFVLRAMRGRNMKYASEDLKNEHEGILEGLTILDKMVHMIRENDQYEIADLREMINFFRLFADKCHHGKEEDILFAAMEKAGIKRENGPIGQMLLEHASGRALVSKMAAALEGEPFDPHAFTSSATDYIKLLRAHINKENMVLFPMGDELISLDTQSLLLELFEEHEKKIMGAGTHEMLHELLRLFEQKYLAGSV